jgi:hypothetical protein
MCQKKQSNIIGGQNSKNSKIEGLKFRILKLGGKIQIQIQSK